MARAQKKQADRPTQYALDVVAGKLIAGPPVRGACQRHLNDLDRAKSQWPYYYDEQAARDAIAFFEEILCLNSGDYEGRPFLLIPWQAFIVGSLFGWKRKADGYRRFRVAYIETAKGSGKSPLCAGIGMKGLVADGEARAEIYAAATHKDQAKILFRDALAMYDNSPELLDRLTASGTGDNRWNLAYLEKGSFFRVISSENKGKSGPRPHMGLLDEVHEHPNNSVIEMIRAGFKFRKQPLNVMITNSGCNMQTVCGEYHEMGIKIACEQLENDELFAYICALDDEDLKDDRYLRDETCWIKANPSLNPVGSKDEGIPGYGYIRGQVREAEGLPSKMSTVKRLNFCVWTEAENPAIGKDVWTNCQDKDYPLGLLYGRRCWGGLDLSAVNDLTAFALVFEPGCDDPYWRLKVWFWMPGIGLVRKSDKDRVPYIAWKEAGHINAIDRKTIDYEFVAPDIKSICNQFEVQKIGFDRWNIKNFEKALETQGITLPELVEIGQGFQSMSPAIKVFETKLSEGDLRHDGNPCLTWCAANVVAIQDPAENKKYDKSRSNGRIDGIVAAVMACGILEPESGDGYEARAKRGEQEIIRSL